MEFNDYDNDIDLYESMVDFVSNNDMSNEDNYKKALWTVITNNSDNSNLVTNFQSLISPQQNNINKYIKTIRPSKYNETIRSY